MRRCCWEKLKSLSEKFVHTYKNTLNKVVPLKTCSRLQNIFSQKGQTMWAPKLGWQKVKNVYRKAESRISQLSYALSSAKKSLKLASISALEELFHLAQLEHSWEIKNHLLKVSSQYFHKLVENSFLDNLSIYRTAIICA